MMIKGIARHSYSVPLLHFSIIPFPLPIPRRYRKIKGRAPVGVVLRQKAPSESTLLAEVRRQKGPAHRQGQCRIGDAIRMAARMALVGHRAEMLWGGNLYAWPTWMLRWQMTPTSRTFSASEMTPVPR